MSRSRLGLGLLAILALGLAPWPSKAAGAQPAVQLGAITSEKECKLYEESAGSTAVIATPHAIGMASSWRTWLVKDCVDKFASLRNSLEAALASSGKIAVSPKAGYVLTARISNVSGADNPPPRASPHSRDGYSFASSNMFVNMDVSLRDATGKVIYGTLFTKRIETGSDVSASGFRATSNQSGEALYGELQHEVALTVARRVAFHLSPLSVVGGDGRTIQLNYGAPLLTLGTIVQVTSPDRGATVRYAVTSAGDGISMARVDGDGEASRIVAGSTGIVIEADDPAANARRFERVDLP